MRTLLREPLVLLALIGASVFGIHVLRGGSLSAGGEDEVIVDDAVTARLAAEYERREGAPPSDPELREAVDRWVADQVLVGEARALGLDRGDLVVERRLAQKMRFLLESESDPPEPTDHDLQAVLDAEPDAWRVPARMTLRHRFFRAERTDPEADAEAAVSSDAAGDPFIHGPTFAGDARALDARFGPGFAAAVSALPRATWAGPVTGSLGVHIVLIESWEESRIGTVADHREELTRRWSEARRTTLRRERTAALVDRWTVTRE